MGDYADDSWDPGDRDSWTESRTIGYPTRHRYSRLKMPACSTCHKSHLYWRQDRNDKWFLTEFDKERQVYEQHTCKFKWK